MKVRNKKTGDIYYNPIGMDFWILRKHYDPDIEKEEWFLSLVHDDYEEKLKNVEGFCRVGNLYDLIFKENEL